MNLVTVLSVSLELIKLFNISDDLSTKGLAVVIYNLHEQQKTSQELTTWISLVSSFSSVSYLLASCICLISLVALSLFWKSTHRHFWDWCGRVRLIGIKQQDKTFGVVSHNNSVAIPLISSLLTITLIVFTIWGSNTCVFVHGPLFIMQAIPWSSITIP